MILGEWYELVLAIQSQLSLSLTLKLVKNKTSWGFYIPQSLCFEKQLIGQLANVELKYSEYVPVTFSEINKVRILNIIVERYAIHKGDLYKVEIKTDQQQFQEIVLINNVDRSNVTNRSDEHYFLIRFNELQGLVSGSIKIISKVDKIPLQENFIMKENIYLPNLFPEAILGKIDADKMVIFLGNHKPIITSITIKIVDIIHYFGCYYADGTKSGSWSINGSTPEQALYYISVFNKLILNPDLNFRLVYTITNFLDDVGNIKSYLKNKWKESTNIDITLNNIYLSESIIGNKIENYPSTKHNTIGSLRIIDNKSLVLDLHKKILNIIESFLLSTNDIYSSWQFLFGILEGDGSVGGGKNRCRITFTEELPESSDALALR